jgi:predicted nucleic acid-binding protein
MAPAGLTYDTGALIAAERNDRAMWALHRAALLRGVSPVVPAGVLAEAWRGGPQASLSRLLQGCEIEALSEKQARNVGALAARARKAQIIHVCVVEAAVRRNHTVVTSDPSDLRMIADAAKCTLVLHVV